MYLVSFFEICLVKIFKIYYFPELDLMSHKLAFLKSSYKSSSTNSPRGRGHRTVKKKVLEDFIQLSDTLSKEKEEKTDKFSKKTQVCNR